MDPLPSRDCVAAGVKGGECTLEFGGECFGDGSADPAGRCCLLGVVVPECTFVLYVSPAIESYMEQCNSL